MASRCISLLAGRLCASSRPLSSNFLIGPQFRLNPANFTPKYLSTTPSIMAPKAVVIVANGAEEMEAVTTIDVLRRAGIDVTVAGLNGSAPVVCGQKVTLVPDVGLSDAGTDFDAVVLPGGMGNYESIAASKAAGELLQAQEKAGKLVAAICAAPLALKEHGVGKGKSITCYPALSGPLESDSNYKYSQDRVVVDGNLITSRGPGTAFDFALAVAEKLNGPDCVAEICPQMLYQRGK